MNGILVIGFFIAGIAIGYVFKAWRDKDNTSKQVGGGGSTGKHKPSPDKK